MIPHIPPSPSRVYVAITFDECSKRILNVGTYAGCMAAVNTLAAANREVRDKILREGDPFLHPIAASPHYLGWMHICSYAWDGGELDTVVDRFDGYGKPETPPETQEVSQD